MNLQHRWAEANPWLGTGPIPVEPYISPAYYEKEKEKIFKRVWLCVAREAEVPQPGDYKVKRIAAGDTSAIIVRGKDGKVRAFHNMCSHRGNTVVTETGEETYGASRAGVMTCRFHGWVYGADGALKQVPQEGRFFACFDKADNGLAPIHCDIWQGFVFINLAAQPEESLMSFLGGYADHVAGYDFSALTYHYHYHTMLNCNWKVAHDAFAEAYHVDTIHAGSFPNTFSSGIQNVKLMGPHRTCAVCLTLGANPTPIGTLAAEKARGSLTLRAAESRLPPTINPDRRSDFAFELSVLFPNTLVHVSDGIWFTHQFWPVAHNQTLWEGRYYVQTPQTHSARWALEQAIILQRNAWLEDTATMEDTHRAMQSGAKQVQFLQDDEILIRHGAAVVDQYVQA